MNVTNNKRKKESKEKIKKTFIELLQTKEINEINITELVKKAGITGMTAIIKKWLLNNCKESPEEMIEIINSEYKGKSLEN